MKDGDTIFPPAVIRALQILEKLGMDNRPISIKDVSQSLDIPHASCYRIMKCLAHYGFLREAPYSDSKYQLGSKLCYLGRMVFNGTDLISVAIPHLKALAADINQACQLSTLTYDAVITIEQILPHAAITIIARLGEEIPIHRSAAGQILTAQLPEGKRIPYLERAIKQSESKHVFFNSMESSNNYLDRIYTNGYGVDDQGFAKGIGCLAMPIFDFSQAAVAAVGITGPIHDYYDSETQQKNLHLLQGTCDRISAELGYRTGV